MCTAGPAPSSVSEALDAVRAGLAYLNGVAAADLPGVVQAQCLRELAAAESAHTAAHARLLAAFSAGSAYEDDGQGSARMWLRWQTQITRGAADGAAGWVRRLAAHPALAGALAQGSISPSYARVIAGWTDLLPEAHRGDGDRILLDAAAGGASLADLGGLAEEMAARTATPDPDGDPGDDDGFTGRRVWLDLTFRGAGLLSGDLTPACAAALAAVLESLGKKAGPEDTRTPVQRDHDALEEACRRLAASRCLPDRAGQPTQVQLHLTLDQLRGLPGGPDAEAAWRAGQAAGDGQPGWLTSQVAAGGYACDAAITPIVTGHLDPAALDEMTRAHLTRHRPCPVHGPGQAAGGTAGSCPSHGPCPVHGPGQAAGGAAGSCPSHGPCPVHGPGQAAGGTAGSCSSPAQPASTGPGTGRPGAAPPEGTPAPASCQCATPLLPPATTARLRDTLLRHATGAVSGPGGLAAFLRTRLTGTQFPAISLPLDVGAATEQVPPHLRRAVITRDRHCAFPGCLTPPAGCHTHHILPRSKGGATRLDNLLLLCAFHHLTAVHRWGWSVTLHADGTVTARSPDRERTLHSHSPPTQNA